MNQLQLCHEPLAVLPVTITQTVADLVNDTKLHNCLRKSGADGVFKAVYTNAYILTQEGEQKHISTGAGKKHTQLFNKSWVQMCPQMPPRSLDDTSVPSLVDATQVLLAILYAQHREPAPPAKNAPKLKRNTEIRKLYATGDWSIPKLARKYGISNARVHQILHGRRK